MTDALPPRFACDAMLGSLARWLRAAGYDAAWQADIDDWDLIRQARREHRVLLSCDTGIFRIGIVRDGEIPALQLPCGLSTREQMVRVLEHFHLPLCAPRCMACGGELQAVTKAEVEGRVPERVYQWIDDFSECHRCSQPFWRGSHWDRITSVLQQIEADRMAARV